MSIEAEIEAVRLHIKILNYAIESSRPAFPVDISLLIAERDLFASVLRRLEGMQWRPIEDAPKDGTKILIARIAPTEGSENLGIEARPPHVWWAVQGWWSDKWGRWFDGVEPSGLASPTHFMPIPEAPL